MAPRTLLLGCYGFATRLFDRSYLIYHVSRRTKQPIPCELKSCTAVGDLCGYRTGCEYTQAYHVDVGIAMCSARARSSTKFKPETKRSLSSLDLHMYSLFHTSVSLSNAPHNSIPDGRCLSGRSLRISNLSRRSRKVSVGGLLGLKHRPR